MKRIKILHGAPMLLRSLAAVVVAVALWEGIVVAFHIPSYVIPTPLSAAKYVFDNWSTIQPLFLQTLKEICLGFVVGVAAGLILAVIMSEVRLFHTIVYPLLIATQATPIIAIAPPLVIIMGFGITPKLTIVGLIVFFPVIINVLSGLSSVDADVLALCKSIGTSRLRLLLLVKLPSSLVPLGAALRIGATYAVTGAVIGEWTATTTPGLGNDILNQQSALNTPAVFGEVLILTGIGIAGFVLMSGVERLITPWRRRAQARGLLQSRYRRHVREGLNTTAGFSL
jgi:NitT/TauT family transport system permease protein